MHRYNFIVLAGLIGALLANPAVCKAEWTFTYPSENDALNKSMSVNAYGNGEGAATSLYFKVEQTGGGNHGLGSWGGGPSPWTASCAPPAGGWQVGGAVLKIWKLGDENSGDPPIATLNVTFQ